MINAPSRISALFGRKRPALIGYIVTGDYDLETTAAVVESLADNGVDCIELGIPYGDPLADGPTNAAAAHRALERGVGIDDVFAVVRSVAPRIPVILFTYANPVVQYGIEGFAEAAAVAGADGAIVPDIPLEESATIGDALRSRGLMMPLLVAPTTPTPRAKAIARASDGFVYLVSRLGVTGAGQPLDTDAIRVQIARLREVTERPIAVGFGISCAQHVAAIAPYADGLIVGSALVDAIGGKAGAAAAEAAKSFVEPLAAALR